MGIANKVNGDNKANKDNGVSKVSKANGDNKANKVNGDNNKEDNNGDNNKANKVINGDNKVSKVNGVNKDSKANGDNKANKEDNGDNSNNGVSNPFKVNFTNLFVLLILNMFLMFHKSLMISTDSFFGLTVMELTKNSPSKMLVEANGEFSVLRMD